MPLRSAISVAEAELRHAAEHGHPTGSHDLLASAHGSEEAAWRAFEQCSTDNVSLTHVQMMMAIKLLKDERLLDEAGRPRPVFHMHQFEEMFEAADTDHDNKITFDEVRMLMPALPSRAHERLQGASPGPCLWKSCHQVAPLLSSQLCDWYNHFVDEAHREHHKITVPPCIHMTAAVNYTVFTRDHVDVCHTLTNVHFQNAGSWECFASCVLVSQLFSWGLRCSP